MGLATGRKCAAWRERDLDCYETPPEAVEALLAYELLPRCLWEPACGPGAIVRVLRKHGHEVYATDVADYGCPNSEARVDFLMEWAAPPRVQAIITNPPYMIANAFVQHAVTLAPRVYMLLPLAFLAGGRRDARRDQLIDGGQLAKVLLFRERLPMMHRHGWEGKKSTSTQEFAWFVWEREHRGPKVLERLSWERWMARALKAKAALAA